MSHATGMCRFPDGEIRYFDYNGTVDVPCPELLLGYEELWQKIRRTNLGAACSCGQPPEDVECFTDYGYGYHWPTQACKACKTCSCLVDTSMPVETERGFPEWAESGYPKDDS